MTQPEDIASSDDGAMLARRLRKARELLNVSQQFVAEQTGIPRSAISDVERGTRRVDSLELKRLAAVYRMPVEYFLGHGEDKIGSGDDPTVRALARAATEMSATEKEEVLRFALFLQNYERSPGGTT